MLAHFINEWIKLLNWTQEGPIFFPKLHMHKIKLQKKKLWRFRVSFFFVSCDYHHHFFCFLSHDLTIVNYYQKHHHIYNGHAIFFTSTPLALKDSKRAVDVDADAAISLPRYLMKWSTWAATIEFKTGKIMAEARSFIAIMALNTSVRLAKLKHWGAPGGPPGGPGSSALACPAVGAMWYCMRRADTALKPAAGEIFGEKTVIFSNSY